MPSIPTLGIIPIIIILPIWFTKWIIYLVLNVKKCKMTVNRKCLQVLLDSFSYSTWFISQMFAVWEITSIFCNEFDLSSTSQISKDIIQHIPQHATPTHSIIVWSHFQHPTYPFNLANVWIGHLPHKNTWVFVEGREEGTMINLLVASVQGCRFQSKYPVPSRNSFRIVYLFPD